ncbi:MULTISPECIES: type III-B CRISPR module RAMP protein Cmr6 [Marichromatium]|uniref:CRISPR-associated protein Cmr6 n=1 Tax=Marichromatium gracile TaxID=1048 RepID=A0A4V2W9M1_MARGR|nr:type III-B CRISPR module RAMP protein Cmr6 [Marichromatium gracile]MBK1708199.1 type III-B CRISPR module RAMP protein Cmr6 [Marichromatium gracile]MBO8085989.1 type III-B CRISPR module RAMP protein Cmr6 [Marichromatium sp.]TCW35880.1 CRISPR-associated protein Cmr6 [Marichromatium gracile]
MSQTESIVLQREAVRKPYGEVGKEGSAHPGLLIQRGLAVHGQDDKEAKTKHIRAICGLQPGTFYRAAFERWRNATADPLRFTQLTLALETRLFIGLSGGGALETGCAVGHSHGAPYLPGSSVKGVVRAYVERSEFATQHPEAIAELFGVGPQEEEEHPEGLAGLVTFHDAWWKPDAEGHSPFVQEVVTTHHLKYYGSEGKTPATDLDSPIPNAQIAVRGSFLFVLEGPPGWRDLAAEMLRSALGERGIGAKTRSGYGVFDTEPQTNAAPVERCAWVDERVAAIAQANRSSEQEALMGKGLAGEWAALEDATLKARALVDIRSRWPQEQWEAPSGKSAKKARAIYAEGEEAAST